MEIAPEAVEVEHEHAAKRVAWAAENPLVRTIQRVPLPLGAKLIAGFTVIAALLAVGYTLGFVALRQSNSRGEQLNELQRQSAYVQLLLSDATELKGALDRLNHLAAPAPSVTQGYATTLTESTAALCLHAGFGGGYLGFCGPGTSPRKGLTLAAIDPPLSTRLHSDLPAFSGLPGYLSTSFSPTQIATQDQRATALVSDLTKLRARTQLRASALVAQNHASYVSSRNVFIGVGAATFVLVLGLGLLLSSSVVVPIRRTRARLAALGAGDYSSRVVVPNRDEIGGLAEDVNAMSSELQRVHQELELASTHKSQFLANMSHELRTPLNAIIGFSEVLHEQMFGELNERQLAYVDDIREAGKHQLSLINEILDLAKIEAGRMELDLSEVSLPEILRSAVSMHNERANEQGVELSIATDPEEITITADERRLRQIVFNLVSNAVKFTPSGGRIDISARLEESRVEVAVADTGPGIAAEDLETIFEEFEQTSAGRQAEGTGLGLPLSRKLVELHGGRLWVESEVGRGSTFRFTLPVHQEVS